ncbi:unnamed protein product [Coffea canephora]|uniref:Uncharacterized protein n=1 Tax=Coffea canephora TaxID=49390 RepID=A0A068UB49_COFCA|nr:unnamed protein product [Coffea canephora]
MDNNPTKIRRRVFWAIFPLFFLYLGFSRLSLFPLIARTTLSLSLRALSPSLPLPNFTHTHKHQHRHTLAHTSIPSSIIRKFFSSISSLHRLSFSLSKSHQITFSTPHKHLHTHIRNLKK